MELLHLPFFTEIQEARSILVAGAGGGFDLFCGLPLYFGLRDAIRQTETYWDVSSVIRRFHASLPAVRAWRDLPM